MGAAPSEVSHLPPGRRHRDVESTRCGHAHSGMVRQNPGDSARIGINSDAPILLHESARCVLRQPGRQSVHPKL